MHTKNQKWITKSKAFGEEIIIYYETREDGVFLLPGTWGIYPWFEEDGEELIEERYRDKFRRLKPYGKIFRCVGERDEFIELQYNGHSYLVKPQLFKKVPTPKFNFGDTVRLRKKPEVIGTISEINWHNQTEKEMYFIEVDGKKKSSRYFSEELISMECE